MSFWGLLGLELAALVMALRRPRHLPLVGLLAYAVTDHGVIGLLHAFVFTDPVHPVRVAVNRHGWPAQAAYHLETALVLGWPAVLAGAAWATFAWRPAPSHLQGKPRESTQGYDPKLRFQPHHTSRLAAELLLGAWLVAAGGLAACYPLPRGWTAPLLHVAEGAFVLAAWAPVPRAWRRPWALPHVCVLVLLAVESSVCLIGPWVRNPFADWHLARLSYSLGFGAIVALHLQRVRAALRL